MTEDPRERKPLAWRQDMGNIHRRLHPSAETAQVTAALKQMARKICEAACRGEPWDEQREVQWAHIMDGEWVA